jgi:nitroreductase
MKVMEAIETRRSIRNFKPDPIEREKLIIIAEAFRLSPSARNGQNWKLLIVTDPEKMELIRKAALGAPQFLQYAPALLVACGLQQGVMTCGHRTDSVDVSIAMAFCVLEAWELGLGTCWMASYMEQDVRDALELPQDMSIVAISPLGYPSVVPASKPRKNLEEVTAII